MAQGLKKWFQEKWVDNWFTEKGRQVSRVWKKVCKFFQQEIPEMRTTCKSHTDERFAKGECCQKKRSAPNTGPKPTFVKTLTKKYYGGLIKI
jgi:hypothetical protein